MQGAGRRCPWNWGIVERIGSVYLGLIHLGFSLAVIVGGAIRFPPPTYAPLLDLTGGHVWPYGLLYGTSAVLLIAGTCWWVRALGALVGIVANSTFSALFLVAVFMFSDAAATAWWAYFGFATLSAALLGLIWTHRPRRNDDSGR